MGCSPESNTCWASVLLTELTLPYEVSVEGRWLMFASWPARWSLSGLSANHVGGATIQRQSLGIEIEPWDWDWVGSMLGGGGYIQDLRHKGPRAEAVAVRGRRALDTWRESRLVCREPALGLGCAC